MYKFNETSECILMIPMSVGLIDFAKRRLKSIMVSKRNSLFGHVVRLDDHTPAHSALSQVAAQQELAPALVVVGGDGQDARAIHGSSRSATVYTLQHSCRMVQGSSSWPLWVDTTDLCCLRDLMMMMYCVQGSQKG